MKKFKWLWWLLLLLVLFLGWISYLANQKNINFFSEFEQTVKTNINESVEVIVFDSETKEPRSGIRVSNSAPSPSCKALQGLNPCGEGDPNQYDEDRTDENGRAKVTLYITDKNREQGYTTISVGGSSYHEDQAVKIYLDNIQSPIKVILQRK